MASLQHLNNYSRSWVLFLSVFISKALCKKSYLILSALVLSHLIFAYFVYIGYIFFFFQKVVKPDLGLAFLGYFGRYSIFQALGSKLEIFECPFLQNMVVSQNGYLR